MKKIFIAFIFLVFAFSFYGCTPKTEYDDKTIAKIETTWAEGMAPFQRAFVRVFDFEKGKITDTAVVNIETYENLSDEEKSEYNNPVLIAEFCGDQAAHFTERIMELGFYAWEDEYVTSDIICDGGSYNIAVYFTDGTVKPTCIYFKDPPDYSQIQIAFENYLGAGLYFDWNNWVSVN